MLIYTFVWKTNFQSANAFDIDFFFPNTQLKLLNSCKISHRELVLPYTEYTRNFNSNF